jgi:hypothetical protein
MKNKITGILIVVLLAIASYTAYYFYIHRSHTMVPGKYGLSVQFVTDTLGVLHLVEKNDSLLLEGSSVSLDSSGYVYLSGYVTGVVPDSFVFHGNINLYAFDDCCGKINQTGSWTFRRMLNRSFYRLKERDTLCDCYKCCIYLDVHF